jgi:lipopolysaccharide export system protein LptC
MAGVAGVNAATTGRVTPEVHRTPAQRVRRTLDLIMGYLPVLLMGLLAMVTYWLVRQTPEPPPAEAVRAQQHVPDYFMREFSLKVYAPDGRLESRVQGEYAQHFPDTDTLEVSQPRMTKVDARGQVTEATARHAITTPEGQRIELKGQAVVRREGGLDAQGRPTQTVELRSDYLFVDLERDRVRTDQPVELVRGRDRFSADALDYDHDQGTTLLSGRVRGWLYPRSTR